MAIPVKRKVRVVAARYIKDAESILLVGECSEGKLQHQIHRSCFSFGTRTEKQIVEELEKTARMFIGKEVEMVFDPDLNGKIEDHVSIKY